jgi:hydroxymethylpyrimidine pyrophosphatase-like HAD family hydrolase
MLVIKADKSVPVQSFFEDLENHFPFIYFEGSLILPKLRLYVREIDARTVNEILEWLKDYSYPANDGYWRGGFITIASKTTHFIEIGYD